MIQTLLLMEQIWLLVQLEVYVPSWDNCTKTQVQLLVNLDPNSTLTQFEGYDGSAWGKIGGGDLSIAGDSGTDSVELGVDTFTFAGGTGLSSTVTNNQVEYALDNTAVSAGSYGSGSAIRPDN